MARFFTLRHSIIFLHSSFQNGVEALRILYSTNLLLDFLAANLLKRSSKEYSLPINGPDVLTLEQSPNSARLFSDTLNVPGLFNPVRVLIYVKYIMWIKRLSSFEDMKDLDHWPRNVESILAQCFLCSIMLGSSETESIFETVANNFRHGKFLFNYRKLQKRELPKLLN